MSVTKSLIRQHEELLKVAGDITALLKPEQLAKDASAVTKLLAQLGGKIKMHLAMEDKSLYPSLQKHDDPDVRAIASKFATEMGGISKAVMAYLTKWQTAKAIQEDPRSFESETKVLFVALANRIQMENKELYPLVSEAATTSVS